MAAGARLPTSPVPLLLIPSSQGHGGVLERRAKPSRRKRGGGGKWGRVRPGAMLPAGKKHQLDSKGKSPGRKGEICPLSPSGACFHSPLPVSLSFLRALAVPLVRGLGGAGAAGWWHLTWGHKAGQEDEPLQGGRGHSHGAGGRGQEVSGRCAAAPDGRRVAKGPRTTLIRPAPRHLAASPEMSRGGSRTKCRAHSQSWPGSFTACAVQRGEQVKSEVIRAWELHGGGTGWCKCW